MVQVSQPSSFGRRVVAPLRAYDLIAQGLHQQYRGFPAGWGQEIM